jgi:hypothetical protein
VKAEVSISLEKFKKLRIMHLEFTEFIQRCERSMGGGGGRDVKNNPLEQNCSAVASTR